MSKNRKIFNPDSPPNIEYPNGRFEPSVAELRLQAAFGGHFGYLTPEGRLQSGFPHASSSLADDLGAIASSRHPSVQQVRRVLDGHGFDGVLNTSLGLLERLASNNSSSDEDSRILRHLTSGRRVVVYSARSGLCHTFAKRPEGGLFDPGVMEEGVRTLEDDPLAALSIKHLQTLLTQAPLKTTAEFEAYRGWLLRLHQVIKEQIATLARQNFINIGSLQLGSGANHEIDTALQLTLARGGRCRVIEDPSFGKFQVYATAA